VSLDVSDDVLDCASITHKQDTFSLHTATLLLLFSLHMTRRLCFHQH